MRPAVPRAPPHDHGRRASSAARAADRSGRSCWRTTACCSWTSSRSSRAPTLEALRQPLEDGRVAIARARHSAVYPARFMLLAATNPCPCGYAGEGDRCRCSEADMARHRRRLSGPLLDRIDLLGRSPARPRARSARARRLTSSAQAREQVREHARARRRGWRERESRSTRRWTCACCGGTCGSTSAARRCCAPPARRGLLSARGEHRVLRVARTIADLDASERVRARDLGAALALRPELSLAGNRAA